jgi:hypothetical protein
MHHTKYSANEQQLILIKYSLFDGKPITVLKPLQIRTTALTYTAMKLNQNIKQLNMTRIKQQEAFRMRATIGAGITLKHEQKLRELLVL